MNRYFVFGMCMLMIHLTGCAESEYDNYEKVQSGMSLELKGPTGRRICYAMQSYSISDDENSTASQNAYGAIRFKKNKSFHMNIDSQKNGHFISVYVPFDGEVTLNLIHNGKVVQTKKCSEAGSILKIELGKLPKDREFSPEYCRPDSQHQKLIQNVLDAIANENSAKLSGTESFEEEVKAALPTVSKKLCAKYGSSTQSQTTSGLNLPWKAG